MYTYLNSTPKYGQCGTGNNVYSSFSSFLKTISNATQVSAGEYFSVVLVSSGSVYTFGIGSRIGTGSSSNSLSPTNITISGVKFISSGRYHTLMLIDNRVSVFGLNNVFKISFKL
jgi:alpha-tubulin suppressor-like RCC1 family protein